MCLLKIFCDYDKRVGTLEVLEADRPIMVGETTVRTTSPLKDGDTIRIDVGQFLKCNFSERIIEEERNIIRTLEVSEVTHHFSSGDVGLGGNFLQCDARGAGLCDGGERFREKHVAEGVGRTIRADQRSSPAQ